MGGLEIKLGFKGLPDRMVLMPDGKVFFAELKRHDGRLSDLQEVWIARLVKLGFHVYTPMTKEHAREAVRDWAKLKKE